MLQIIYTTVFRVKRWYKYLIYFDVMHLILFVCLVVLNAFFNNISVIAWRSVLLAEETRGTGENHRSDASHWKTLSHNVVHLALIEIRTHNISGDAFEFVLKQWAITAKSARCCIINYLYNSYLSIDCPRDSSIDWNIDNVWAAVNAIVPRTVYLSR